MGAGFHKEAVSLTIRSDANMKYIYVFIFTILYLFFSLGDGSNKLKN
jgi:hypothetical protein